ncbi:MAG TPA: DUF1559 domain-containing protein [Isosphaeraceae bacterium]|nr:DUF1559 domain-containing protein [Isosphaeraceae bacterium]
MRRPFPLSFRSTFPIVGVLALVAATAQARPPEAKGPARAIPREDLVLFVEFDGLDERADAWRATAAYKMLNKTGAGAMIRDLVGDVLDRVLVAQGPEGVVTTEQLLAIDDLLARKGFVFAINRRAGDPKSGGITLVLRGAATGDAGRSLRRLIEAGTARGPKPEPVAKAGGRRVHVVPGSGPTDSGWAWWAEGDDLIFSLGSADGADPIINTLENSKLSALDHPTRVELLKEERGFRPVGLAFIDLTLLPQSVFPPQARSLGLDGVKRLDVRWGFHDDALMSVLRVAAPAPRRGVLTLFEAPPFRKGGLPPIPPDQASFTVLAFKPDRLYEQIMTIAKALTPNAEGVAEQVRRGVMDATGLRLREDILAHLGPRVAFYVVPTIGSEPTNPFSGFFRGYVHIPKAVALVEVDDPAAFGKSLDALAKAANDAFGRLADRQGGDGKKPLRAELRAVKGGPKGYMLVVPPGVFPLPAGTKPTILIGEHYLALARTPEQARKALALESKPDGRRKPSDALAKAFEALPDELTYLSISDPRDSLLPETIVNLPNIVQTIGSMASNGPSPMLRGPMGAALRGPIGMVRGPQHGGFRVHTDPDKVPSADELRSYLFPATVAVSVDDQGLRIATREAFPSLNPIMAAPIAAGLMLPAVQSARSAAQRAQSTNNLKQMGLALLNYVSTNDTFPPAASRSKDGKALLSWRVAILPYLEQAALYNEFHLDEPWDSEHNKALIDKMPEVFKVPGSTTKEPGLTFYRGFSGKGAFFDGKDGIKLAQITDGTSNTIGVVEAKEAVIWTKPDTDIEFDPEKSPLSQLGGHFRGGFNALILDGSVRFIKETVNETVLKALITYNGGEVVSPDAF